MSDYSEELGPEDPGQQIARNFRRLQVLAVMNGVDIEIDVPPASKRAIAELPVHEILESEVGGDLDCSICKEPAKEGEKFKIMPCKHEFHEECIVLWLNKRNTCPLCRFEVESNDPAYEELRKFKQNGANAPDSDTIFVESMKSFFDSLRNII
ncbi:E3 ubiquitin-protein ligase RNF181 homolog [Drosophila eugracilis]|uniref:E3 ubiquitin-protein ligase RNF181 homolog n=1 Tax=Drosophila eugracilis TaxID=29029 RepID=UPI001BDAA925|nr:E3 ubiquitin-protein ligase RNF181 homolog [Drosophila eugracilis]